MAGKSALLATLLVAATINSTAIRAQREVTERHVYVGVKTAADAPAQGLTAADFLIRENDTAREVIRVSASPPPSHLALLVDDSGPLQPLLIDVRKSLVSFVQGMAALNPPPTMTLTTLAERPTTVVKATTSDIALERAIQRIVPRPGSGTYLLEGIMEACAALRLAKAERPAIVAFVIDSSTPLDDLLHSRVADALKEAKASLWTVELQQGRPPNSNPERERALVIGDVTTWSGGLNRPSISQQGLAKAFSDIAAAMAARYDVTYGRPASLVPPSRLTVETRDKTLRVSAPRWTQ